ncbi:MAG: carnitine dehydratase [Betaproteobacteria bacterium RIFCSPLOWO2_12_FULL_64_23]|nr:MAG: carnitine dehydratase [Betaproteobacteria bacterium RIFCSPLOWO2_12_FULL_64_23]
MFQFEKIEESLPLHAKRDPGADTAIGPIRVIDFTHFIAGPFATMLLADFGADVIKIESPGKGEDFRYFPPLDPKLAAQGAPFLWTNRTKRSVGIDLKSPQGLEIVRELIATADVLVENFSTGVMQRFGLDYEQCKAINPNIIYCSVSAYGREGAFSDRLGFDPVVQAESGFMSMNGFPDRDGVRTASVVMDIGTAMMASNAILAALLSRERSGKGQCVEVALFDTAVLMTGFAAMQHLCTGFDPQRTGNYSPDTSPSGLFKAKDRPIYVNCANTKIFQRLFANVLGMPEVANDPALTDATGRIKNRKRLFAVLNEKLAEQSANYWQEKFRAAGITSGEVRTLGEALASDEARARGVATRIAHPAAGWIPNIKLPIQFSRTPAVDPVPAPAVGQHTAEVLKGLLGYGEDRIAALTRSGVIG